MSRPSHLIQSLLLLSYALCATHARAQVPAPSAPPATEAAPSEAAPSEPSPSEPPPPQVPPPPPTYSTPAEIEPPQYTRVEDSFIDESTPPPPPANTPRDGIFSTYFFSIDLGYASLQTDAARRVDAGPGFALQLRLGAALWDHVLFGLGFGLLFPNDRAPFIQRVMLCDRYSDYCDDPESHESNVTAPYVSIETGGQHRFRPSDSFSIVPGAAIGFAGALERMSRGVDCDTCERVPLDAKAEGLYLAPFVRMTFGGFGAFGCTLRSQWFVTGDLQQITTLGVDLGVP